SWENTEGIGNPDHCFRAAETEETARPQHPCHAPEHALSRYFIEINEHIAAENEIERPKPGRDRITQKIEVTELDHCAQFFVDAPALAVLDEIFLQQFRRQSALNLEGRIPAVASALKHLLRNI